MHWLLLAIVLALAAFFLLFLADLVARVARVADAQLPSAVLRRLVGQADWLLHGAGYVFAQLADLVRLLKEAVVRLVRFIVRFVPEEAIKASWRATKDVARSAGRLVHAPARGLWEGIWATTVPWLALAWVGGALVFGGAFVETVARAIGAPPSVWPSTGLAWVATGLYNAGASLGGLVAAFKSLRDLGYWLISSLLAVIGAIVPFEAVKIGVDAWFGGVVNATYALPGGVVSALGGDPSKVGDLARTVGGYLAALVLVAISVSLLVCAGVGPHGPVAAGEEEQRDVAPVRDRRRRSAVEVAQ